MSLNECVRDTAQHWAPDDVIVSASLFRSIISLLEEFDIEDYPSDTVQLYGYVLLSLNKIKANIDFKEAFTQFFYSNDGRTRFSLHMDSALRSPEDSIPF